jgi:hypothetical protein
MEAVIMRYYKEKILLADEPKQETEVKEEPKKEVEEGAQAESPEKSENGSRKRKYEAIEDKIAWVKKFKGSIFVVFKTEEQAKAALADITTYGGVEVGQMLF